MDSNERSRLNVSSTYWFEVKAFLWQETNGAKHENHRFFFENFLSKGNNVEQPWRLKRMILEECRTNPLSNTTVCLQPTRASCLIFFPLWNFFLRRIALWQLLPLWIMGLWHRHDVWKFVRRVIFFIRAQSDQLEPQAIRTRELFRFPPKFMLKREFLNPSEWQHWLTGRAQFPRASSSSLPRGAFPLCWKRHIKSKILNFVGRFLWCLPLQNKTNSLLTSLKSRFSSRKLSVMSAV